MPRILTCDRCYEEWWMEEDEEEPCPYCAEDRLEAARDAYWDMKIWGFFAMIDLGCGINWADPVPRMTEGRVDIRKIMGVGGDRIVDVVFNSMTKTADGKITRTYDVYDSRNEITQITVESR